MYKNVGEYIKQCSTCAKNKPRSWREKQMLLPLPIATKSFAEIEVDFIPFLPESGDKKYTCIATFVDCHSKIAIFVPTHDTLTSEQLAQLYIRNIFPHWGLPTRWISDNDTIIDSTFYNALLHDLHIPVTFAAPFHKDTTGLVDEQTKQLNHYCEHLFQMKKSGQYIFQFVNSITILHLTPQQS